MGAWPGSFVFRPCSCVLDLIEEPGYVRAEGQLASGAHSSGPRSPLIQAGRRCPCGVLFAHCGCPWLPWQLMFLLRHWVSRAHSLYGRPRARGLGKPQRMSVKLLLQVRRAVGCAGASLGSSELQPASREGYNVSPDPWAAIMTHSPSSGSRIHSQQWLGVPLPLHTWGQRTQAQI